ADLDGLATWARSQQARPKGAAVVTLPGLEDQRPPDFDDFADASTDGRDADESGMAVMPPPDVARDQAPDSSERASIVEAIDDLPSEAWRGPEGQHVSRVGLARLAGLSSVVRGLRGLTGLPLADLVGETERALGLDIEVLARPEHTPTTARAHLDAFADVAATFSVSADRPTLGGFLAWIDAAVEQERGLDTPTIETSNDAVQVLTVHAAKGLEWDCVAIPGLVEGSFPARANGVISTASPDGWRVGEDHDKGWCVGADGVPYELRGDRDGLPDFRWRFATDWVEIKRAFEDFVVEGGRHSLAEERRLAYVAFTRARSALLLTAPVWSDAATPRVTSTFLTEALDPASGLDVAVTSWAPMPPIDPPKPPNPRLVEPATATWPTDPLAVRRAELADAVERVTRAMQLARERAEPDAPLRSNGDDPQIGRAPEAELASLLDLGLDPELARDLQLLLRERAVSRERRHVVVEVPRHLSASAVVQLATDRDRYALQLRRPMPSAPALAARRGTAFHAWVEEHFARAAMVDVLDLPGSADDEAGDDADLPRMKELFLASEWSEQVPEAIEISVETMLDCFALRGRIDAVFPRDGGGYTIVDWKTGHEPTSREARPRALQLATYALAYARLRGLPASQVDGAFYYAATGTTVRPRLPRERDLLTLLGSIADGPVTDREG
ncbi:MAG: PD-(D/E)XK nuclease family protein, partial [Lapillicoccus sp.]